MASDVPHPVFGLIDRLRSSVRTGRRLRLDPEHVRVLMSEDIYTAIIKLEAKEIREECQKGNLSVTKSGTIGYGGDPDSAPGQSAGSSAVEMAAVSRGASQLLHEEVALLLRRRKR